MTNVVAGLIALLCAAAAAHAEDRKLGTAILWEASIAEAAAKARREGKLVLALHVSGQFDKREFT